MLENLQLTSLQSFKYYLKQPNVCIGIEVVIFTVIPQKRAPALYN